jgi:hypothetical protein
VYKRAKGTTLLAEAAARKRIAKAVQTMNVALMASLGSSLRELRHTMPRPKLVLHYSLSLNRLLGHLLQQVVAGLTSLSNFTSSQTTAATSFLVYR